MCTGILFIDDEQLASVEQQLGSHVLLIPLLGKPLVQRAVEKLAGAGCQQIHILLGKNPTGIKKLLQQGERWGCQLHFHYTQPDESMAQLTHRLCLPGEYSYWLGCCSLIPLDPLPAPMTNNLLLALPDGESSWSGWGYLPGSWLLGVNLNWQNLLMNAEPFADMTPMRVQLEQVLDASSLSGLHAAMRHLVTRESRSRPPSTAYLHPSATLIQPVHIGAEVHIGADCIIGPNVVIEQGCYLDKGSHLSDCLLLTNTFVGEDLDLCQVIAHGDQLFNIHTGCHIQIRDPLWLRKLAANTESCNTRQRLLAWLLRLILLPLFLFCKMQINQSYRQAKVSGLWLTHFHDIFYPGLRHVQAGTMLLLGPAMSEHAINASLPVNWRTLYPAHQPGLINDALLCAPEALSPEIQFASDLMACAHQDHLAITLKQLGRYLKLVLLDGLDHHQFA